MDNKELIKNRVIEAREILTGYSKDFATDYDLATMGDYFGDEAWEFADNNSSIYYYDQRNYFNEHSEECEDALIEIYDGEWLADYIKKNGLDALLCFAGAVGECEAIRCELEDNRIEILTALAFEYLHDQENINELSIAKLNEIIALIDNLSDEDTYEVKDGIDELLAKEE